MYLTLANNHYYSKEQLLYLTLGNNLHFFVRLPKVIVKTNIIDLNVKALTLYYRSLLYLVTWGIIIKKEYDLL